MTPEQYISNRAACNITIQQAVSSVMEKTSPNDIQDIVVSGTGSRTNRGLQSSASTRVRFTVRAYITGATYESLSTQLAQAAVTGALTSQVQLFAAQNSVPVLQNVTVLAITTDNELVGRESSEKLTGTMIAGLVIGIIMCLGIIAVIVYFFFSHLFVSAGPAVGDANESNNSAVVEGDHSNVNDVESPREASNQI